MRAIKKPNVRSAGLSLILAATILEFGRTTLGTFCIVEGESMFPTLSPGDVVQSRVSYVMTRGDVVIVADGSGSDAIKRIVGLPGEVVTLYGGEVYVNGRRLLEPYLEEASSTFKNNQKREPAAVWHLETDQYFVLGDNRYGSCDSRHYGPLGKRKIHGVVVLPKNAPEPAFLDILLSESGVVIPSHRHCQTADRSRPQVARSTPRNMLLSAAGAIVH